MLIYRRTSLLDSPAQTLVNTVNCVGVMGKGLAKEFRSRDPSMYLAYKAVCDQRLLSPGNLWIYRGSTYWTLNFPTKNHWRNPSKIEWIEDGLIKFVKTYEKMGITDISFPRLGCGNGGLNWDDVRPLMERYLSNLPIPVFVHDFEKEIGIPEHLSAAAQVLRRERSDSTSFRGFVLSLRRVAQTLRSGASCEPDVTTPEANSAEGGANPCLLVETSTGCWTFDEEALRGVWLSMQKGLLTRENAGWSVAGGGEPLLSLISVLPNARPVEILRMGEAEPELAVEFRSGRSDTTRAPSLPDQQPCLPL